MRRLIHITGNRAKDLIWWFSGLWGLFQQATQHIRLSPERGGEASYSWWDTRPSWVLRNKHPVGAQGRHHSRVGNFPEARPAFGEVPETLWPTGLRTSGETEVRGKCGCFPRARLEVRGRARKVSGPRARVPYARKTVIPRMSINCCLLNYGAMITRLKCQLSGDVLHLCECDYTVCIIYPA